MGEGERSAEAVFAEFGRTFATYFKKPGIWLALVFMLVYRLPEAFLIKMINPFLVASRELGGLALSVEQVGIVYGTIGILFLTIGGILGGIFASRVGLKKSMWVMAVFMTLPCLSFVYLSVFQPTSLVWISVALAIEQFGYGFGFTAYMLFMMYFSEGEFKTAHYAICTAFMALSMMIPGMFAGYLQEWMGYEGFFWMVIACCSATLAVTVFAYRKIDAEYGRK
jgi:PAT family beta-lactamase induction signal transducer AmpG